MAEQTGGLAEVETEESEYDETDSKSMVGPINRVENSNAGEVLEEIVNDTRRLGTDEKRDRLS